jgi:hypothetical protein
MDLQDPKTNKVYVKVVLCIDADMMSSPMQSTDVRETHPEGDPDGEVYPYLTFEEHMDCFIESCPQLISAYTSGLYWRNSISEVTNAPWINFLSGQFGGQE